MAIEVERLIIALEARYDRYEANLRASQTATDARLRAMENRFQRFSSNIRSSASGAALNVQAALAGIGAYLSGRELIQYADGWSSVTRALEANEQIFGMRLRSAKELNALANSARADLDAYAKLYQRTAAATRDLGVAEEDVAKATSTVARLVEARLGVSVRRIGRAPKLLLVYRCHSPIRRSRSTRYRDPTNRLFRPDGKEIFHGIDFWGEGSQFVAYGWHPDTGRPAAPGGRRSTDLRKGRARDVFGVTDPWSDPDWTYDAEPQPPPPFPFELFGGVADVIQQAALGKGAPPDYVASALMAAVSASLQNSREAQIHPEWREPSVLWVANVGRPSANKSPAMDAAIGALDVLQGELNADFESKRTEFEMARRQADIERSAWERKAKAEVEKGGPMPPMPPGALAPREPSAVVLCVSAGSIEKLITRKAGQSEGLLLYADELGGLLSTVSRPDQGHYRAALVAAYGARSFTYDLVKHGQQALRVERFAVSIAGNVQPGKLADVLATADDGLVARFDFIAPSAVPVEAYRGAETGSAFTEALRSLIRLPGDGSVELLDLTPSARKIAEECRQRVRELEADQSELVQGWIGKAPGKAIRYALAFAHLDYAFGHALLPTEISAEHAERGRAYVFDYLLPMMERALGQASVSLGEKRARALFDLIRDKYQPGQQFAVRDLQQHKRHDLREVEEIKQALATLAEGEIVRRERPATGGGRAERWAANPAIWRDGSGIS